MASTASHKRRFQILAKKRRVNGIFHESIFKTFLAEPSLAWHLKERDHPSWCFGEIAQIQLLLTCWVTCCDNRENYGNLKNAQQKRLAMIFASFDTREKNVRSETVFLLLIFISRRERRFEALLFNVNVWVQATWNNSSPGRAKKMEKFKSHKLVARSVNLIIYVFSSAPAACEIEFTPLLLPIELCVSLSSSAASCSPYLRIRGAH